MDHHWDAVGVPSLDCLLKQFALVFQVTNFLTILISLLLDTSQRTYLTLLRCHGLLLLSDYFLVFTEPGNFILEITDLAFGESSLLHVLVTHLFNFLSPLADKELSLVELLLNLSFFISHLVIKGLQRGFLCNPVTFHFIVLENKLLDLFLEFL